MRLAAWGVDRMIRRSLRHRFHTLWWTGPPTLPDKPRIYVPNHHGWHDGYVMYVALKAFETHPFYDWIAEYDAFPLFGQIGGLPFPPHDAARRGATLRRTVRLLREGASLMLFAERDLHRPPELAPFGEALDWLAQKVPETVIVPVALRYELCRHERPEGFIRFGPPVSPGPDLARRTRNAVRRELDALRVQMEFRPEELISLLRGTRDVNERLDLRRFHPRRVLNAARRRFQ